MSSPAYLLAKTQRCCRLLNLLLGDLPALQVPPLQHITRHSWNFDSAQLAAALVLLLLPPPPLLPLLPPLPLRFAALLLWPPCSVKTLLSRHCGVIGPKSVVLDFECHFVPHSTMSLSKRSCLRWLVLDLMDGGILAAARAVCNVA